MHRERVPRIPHPFQRCCTWRHPNCYVTQPRVSGGLLRVSGLSLMRNVYLFFVQKLLYQPEAVVRTSSAIVCGGFGADEIAGLTRTMVWRRRSLSRTKIFRRVARKALSCPRMFDHAFCRSLLTCFNRLGAPPRLCFEKYVDVS